MLIPVGIVLARSFKDLGGLWFHLHRALQTLGFIMGTVALGLGFELSGGWATETSSEWLPTWLLGYPASLPASLLPAA